MKEYRRHILKCSIETLIIKNLVCIVNLVCIGAKFRVLGGSLVWTIERTVQTSLDLQTKITDRTGATESGFSLDRGSVLTVASLVVPYLRPTSAEYSYLTQITAVFGIILLYSKLLSSASEHLLL